MSDEENLALLKATLGEVEFEDGNKKWRGYERDEAVAVWGPPDVPMFDDADEGAFGELLVRELGDRAEPVFQGLLELTSHHPEEPHFYLLALGTRPEVQGKGLGGALVADIAARARAIDAWLEEQDAAVVASYGVGGASLEPGLTVDAAGCDGVGTQPGGLDGPVRHRVHGVRADQLVDVERVGVVGVLRRGRGPEAALLRRALGRERLCRPEPQAAVGAGYQDGPAGLVWDLVRGPAAHPAPESGCVSLSP